MMTQVSITRHTFWITAHERFAHWEAEQFSEALSSACTVPCITAFGARGFGAPLQKHIMIGEFKKTRSALTSAEKDEGV